jgi:hypothetical protein
MTSREANDVEDQEFAIGQLISVPAEVYEMGASPGMPDQHGRPFEHGQSPTGGREGFGQRRERILHSDDIETCGLEA